MDKFFFWSTVLCQSFLFSCSTDKSILDEKEYKGPVLAMDSIMTRYSNEGKVRLVIRARREEQFSNGDKIWPDGMYLEIYEEDSSKLTTTFKSDKAYYFTEGKYYKGEGNVTVKNFETGDELVTEELFWDPNVGKEKFYTERFVTIREGNGELHTGEGLNASQDFSSYEILKPTGYLPVEEQF